MKVLLAPTKKQVLSPRIGVSQPKFISQAEELILEMKALGQNGLRDLLGISEKLSEENWSRVQDWNSNLVEELTPAIFLYTGEAFNYLAPEGFTKDDLKYADSVLRIFSGLYGILKPMDGVMPYRVDIKPYYNYWKSILTDYLISDSFNDELIVNLSSLEYSKSVDLKKFKGKVITPEFKTEVNGKLKTVAIWSKRMRGLLTREIIINRVTTEAQLKEIVLPDYKRVNDSFLYIKE